VVGATSSKGFLEFTDFPVFLSNEFWYALLFVMVCNRHSTNDNYLRQAGYVIIVVCLSVCLLATDLESNGFA